MANKLTAAEFDEVRQTVDRMVAADTQEDADHCVSRLKSLKHEVHHSARFEMDEIISCAEQLRDARIRLDEVNAELEDAKENQAFLQKTLQSEYEKMKNEFVEA